MNKILLTTVFAITTSFIAGAQKISFTDSTNVWYESAFIFTPQAYGKAWNTYYYNGDSVKNNVVYMKMYWKQCVTFPGYIIHCDTSFQGLVREDTSAVYYLDNATNATEQVLYNYNWKPGDSINLGYGKWRKVAEIDSVQINNITHHVWKMQCCFDTANSPANEILYVIEGVGATYGLFHVLSEYYWEYYSELSCFRNNGGNPALSKSFQNGGIGDGVAFDT